MSSNPDGTPIIICAIDPIADAMNQRSGVRLFIKPNYNTVPLTASIVNPDTGYRGACLVVGLNALAQSADDQGWSALPNTTRTARGAVPTSEQHGRDTVPILPGNEQ